MALNNLQVVSVPVSDQDRARQFYAEQLGFTVEIDSSFGEGMRWVMLRSSWITWKWHAPPLKNA